MDPGPEDPLKGSDPPHNHPPLSTESPSSRERTQRHPQSSKPIFHDAIEIVAFFLLYSTHAERGQDSTREFQ